MDTTEFNSFFKSLTHDDCLLRFFERGDTFSVYGSNAEYIAQTFYKTSTVLKYCIDLFIYYLVASI